MDEVAAESARGFRCEALLSDFRTMAAAEEEVDTRHDMAVWRELKAALTAHPESSGLLEGWFLDLSAFTNARASRAAATGRSRPKRGSRGRSGGKRGKWNPGYN